MTLACLEHFGKIETWARARACTNLCYDDPTRFTDAKFQEALLIDIHRVLRYLCIEYIILCLLGVPKCVLEAPTLLLSRLRGGGR